MKLYLSLMSGTRHRFGWKVRFEWPERPITDLDRRTLRRIYRQMRAAGLGEMDARWACYDLVGLGTRATRHDGRQEVSS